jgi:hypothetical protein
LEGKFLAAPSKPDSPEIVRHYSYDSVPTIKRFSQSRAFIRGLMEPFGSGKSGGCVIELVKWAKRQPLVNGKRRARFACIRNTYGQLADTTIKTFLHWLPERVFGTYNKADHLYHLHTRGQPPGLLLLSSYPPGRLVARYTVDRLAVGREWERAVPLSSPTIQEKEVQIIRHGRDCRRNAHDHFEIAVDAITPEVTLNEGQAARVRPQPSRWNRVAEFTYKMPREPRGVIVAEVLADHVSVRDK